jgi:adenine deaminase
MYYWFILEDNVPRGTLIFVLYVIFKCVPRGTNLITMDIFGNLVDIFNRRVYPACIVLENGFIKSITELTSVAFSEYIMPGFVDSHIHVESSMLVPSALSSILLKHGTVAVVCDPHEIVNVAGEKGFDFMLDSAEKSKLKYFFGVPSCVPSSSMEKSGAVIDELLVEKLLQKDKVCCLAEMMNYPGVIQNEPDVLGKLVLAAKYGKPVDGHAPSLSGELLKLYVNAGISTDHECSTIEEAQEKIKLGMKVLIREGSAARNFDALAPLIPEFSNDLMFCTDDAHLDYIIDGHINSFVKKAVRQEYNLFDVLKIASVNPVLHYNLPVGLLREGDSADFIVVDSLSDFNILNVYVDGIQVSNINKNEETFVTSSYPIVFNADFVSEADLKIINEKRNVVVIKVLDGNLWTKKEIVPCWSDERFLSPCLNQDILKLSVLDRYQKIPVSNAFVSGFGFKKIAIATSIAHDCHNLITLGTHDDLMVKVMNAVIESKGGIAVTDGEDLFILPLKIGGLMFDGDIDELLPLYQRIESFIFEHKPLIKAPLMALSFLSLLVIPEVKLGSKGLFDVNTFQYRSIFE